MGIVSSKEGFLLHYLKQFTIIVFISLLGEILSFFIPLPIPASIYGIAIMLALLMSGRLKAEAVKDASAFLIAVMPAMFIPSTVGLMDSFLLLQGSLAAYAVILVVSTVAVMAVSGLVTQRIIRCDKAKKEDQPHA